MAVPFDRAGGNGPRAAGPDRRMYVGDPLGGETPRAARRTLPGKGNAEAVVELFSKRFLYCQALGWLAYNGTHWTRAGADTVLQKAIIWTLRRRYMVAKRAGLKAMKAATKSNIGRIRGAKSLLEGLLHAEVAEFDQRPGHLNVANGVLDL